MGLNQGILIKKMLYRKKGETSPFKMLCRNNGHRNLDYEVPSGGKNIKIKRYNPNSNLI